MVRTDEVSKICMGMNKDPIWRKKMARGDITMVALDIKEQFPSVSKKEAIKALRWSIRKVKKSLGKDSKVALSNCSLEKAMDRITGKQALSGFRMIELDDIMKYVKLEMEFCIGEVNGLAIKQLRGLPIGGYVSAQLASLDAIYKE